MRLRNVLKKLVQSLSGGRVLFRLPSLDRVYLTFDDGPNDEFTPQVLRILRDHRQFATFFLIGENVEKSPVLAAEILAAGHQIGLHTYSHSRIDRMDERYFTDEVHRNQQAIKHAAGIVPSLLRPPWGRLNLSNLRWARRLGIQLVQYSIASCDWQPMASDRIVQSVGIDRLRGGEIICMHDDNHATIESLPTILDQFRARGMACASLQNVLQPYRGDRPNSFNA